MITGIVFIIVWLALAAVWFIMSIMAGAMANDAGTVPSDIHAHMLMLLIAGEAVVAIAGVLGGASFIVANHGAVLWKAFWALFLVGALMQVGAVLRFLWAT